MKRIFIFAATLIMISVALLFSRINIYADYHKNLEDECTYENVFETDNQKILLEAYPEEIILQLRNGMG